MKPRRRAASPFREMPRDSSLDRFAVAALVAALAACASTPQPRTRPLTTLAEINHALSWHLADVELVDEVVMRGLRGVEVTPERLRWRNELGQHREMPIEEVARIVLRGRDPAARPPSEGARMLDESGRSPETSVGQFVEAGFGALDGETGALVGVALGALALAVDQVEEPGIVIYEAPTTRYVADPPAASPDRGPPNPNDTSGAPPPAD